MADKNGTIPVELLLSGIGKQIKVDVEAHRRRLEAEIEKKRQRLAELIERRAEVADLGSSKPEPVLNVDEEPAAGMGYRLFESASQLEDDLSDDWMDPSPAQAAPDGGMDFSGNWAGDLPDPTEAPSPAQAAPDGGMDFSGNWADDLPDPTEEASPAQAAPDGGMDFSGNWAGDLPDPTEEASPAQAAPANLDAPVEDLADILSDVAALDPGLTEDWEEFR